MDIGKRIRDLREERGLTQREVARRAGLTPSGVGFIEHGQTRKPSAETVVAIARALGVPVKELLEEPVAPLGEAASEAGPPQVSQEELAAQGIRATAPEVDEVNYTIADFWRLVRGGQPVAYFRHDDVDPDRVWMLIDLVLDTPSVVTPEAAGVVRQGMREKLKTG